MDYEQLSKFFSGELPPDEKKSLLAALEADEELRKEAARLKNSWATAQLAASPGDEEIARKGWELFSERIQKEQSGSLERDNSFDVYPSLRDTKQSGKNKFDIVKGAKKDILLEKESALSENGKRKKLFIGSKWRVAAAVAILIVASYITGYFVYDKKTVTTYQTMIVPAGQFAQLTLSDGSEIWLNACSKLVYPEKFTSNKREIQLEGEGLFKVVSNKKKPFIVKTGLIDVIATGTQFNVSAYPDDHWIATTLIEGAVKLQSDISYELKSGQIAIYDKQERHITTRNINTDSQISWIHGEYHFEAMALEDITKRLERYYNIVFVFEDEGLKQRKFTGAFFKDQSIESIMRVIETSTPMQYRIIDKVIYIK